MIRVDPEDQDANVLLQHLGLKGSQYHHVIKTMEINIELAISKKYPRGGNIVFDLNPLVSDFNGALLSSDLNFADFIFHTNSYFCNATSEELKQVCSNHQKIDINRKVDFKMFNYDRRFDYNQDKYTISLFKDSLLEVPDYAYIVVNNEVGAYEDHFPRHSFAEALDHCCGYIMKFKLDKSTVSGMIPRIKFNLDKFIEYDFVAPYGIEINDKISCLSKKCAEIDGVNAFDTIIEECFDVSIDEVGSNLTMRSQNILNAFVSKGF